MTILQQETKTNYDWLGLDTIPQDIYNPLTDYPIGQMPNPVDNLMSLFTNSDYLHFTCNNILNFEPLPFQCTILQTLWNHKLPMLIGCRGAGKSTILAVYAWLRMLLTPGAKIVVVGASFRQSKQIFEYMKKIYDESILLQSLASGRKGKVIQTSTDMYRFNFCGSSTIAIPLGDGTRIRGLRANYILCDEYASIPEHIFDVVVRGFASVSSDPLAKVKHAAMTQKLKKKGQWSQELELVSQSAFNHNQIVYSGTAYYAFNHFFKAFKKWHAIIASKGDTKKLISALGGDETVLKMKGFDWKDYAIVRVPYTHLPDGLLDETMIAQAQATMHTSLFLMEYGGVFAEDSDGFYKRSVIEAATTNKPVVLQGGQSVQFNAAREGDTERSYVIGVDPAADADNAAIVVLENHLDHRRIVHCWSTSRKRFTRLRKYYKTRKEEFHDNYYRYLAEKIKKLVSTFNVERIMMDKHGGGTAIEEALCDRKSYEKGETMILPVVDVDKPKFEDGIDGLHILEMVVPTSDLNSEANHGMLKDFQSKTLLFPMFDTIELAKSIQIDKLNQIKFDTYENLVEEIEELKDETCTVECRPSSILGKETFDTPAVKAEGMIQKKGRLRKDRYSALLYANYYLRNKGKEEHMQIKYKAVGGTKDTLKTSGQIKGGSKAMYHGPGTLKFGKQSWLNSRTVNFRKNN